MECLLFWFQLLETDLNSVSSSSEGKEGTKERPGDRTLTQEGGSREGRKEGGRKTTEGRDKAQDGKGRGEGGERRRGNK